MAPLARVVVVGASLAGLQAAQTLRRRDFDGELILVGDEPHYPYDRPPLSKQFLAGDWDEEKLRLRGAADPDALGVEWRLGRRAASLDLEGSQVLLDDGHSLAYDGLVIATGARPRTLPGPADGVHVLRTLDDAVALRDRFDEVRQVTVIGAGFIGAEVAATARERGLDVTLIEAAPAPLSRVLDADAGTAIAELHRQHGVDVRLGVGVEQILGAATVEGVAMADGTEIETDLVLVGIGVIPNTEWLEGSDLELDNGVVCDDTCLVAPGVVAAGDVARWPHPRFGSMRLEQWDNAIDQGGYAAGRLLAWAAGDDVEPFAPVPWFWSDQYDRKIQLAGVTSSNSEIVHGTLDEQRFVQLYLDDDGEAVGALAWNRPRHAIQARQLLQSGAPADEIRATLAD